MNHRHPFRLLVLLLLCIGAAQAQELRERIFGQTDEVRESAEAADGALLSPNAYFDGVKIYDTASQAFDKGKNLERIKDDLRRAAEFFQTALENSDVARLTLAKSLDSRDAASRAEAARLAAADWAEAEKIFDEAARALERGRLNPAKERGDQAHDAYRNAELNAIRARYLTEARGLLAEAENARVEKYAPLTLEEARSLLRKADEGLVRDRYATAEPEDLAAQSSYMTQHAIFIARQVKRVSDGKLTVEQLILNWEEPVDSIAEALGIDADFSRSNTATSKQVVRMVEDLQTAQVELGERDRQILGLEEEIRELDMRLGGASEERTDLIRRLEQQARAREQIEQIEGLFGPDEAVVLRNGNRVILRLVGLNFASGSAQLNDANIELINKARSAINVFPQSELVVEGHTDASGGAQQNMRLSEERAQAVTDYLVSSARIPAHRIKSFGYGDTRPIASNKSADGRKQNRRIDLIIAPRAATTSNNF